MKSQDLFAAGVRLFGVWMLIRCVEYLTAAFELGYLFNARGSGTDSPKGLMTFAAAYLGLAAFFLLGTRRLVAWSYGERPAGKPPGNPEDSI